jgi:alkanesulfonate monooxygenase SsuD/methylene tetrahydromethanopterin reductase-like flavin-dependent oxidoreductase (luciferase family)
VRFGVCSLPSAPWDELVRRWRLLDELGLELLAVPDQLAPRPGLPWLDAWTCLGAMAVVTERTRIGPLVTPISFRNPAAVVKAAVTVDHASGGRLDLGLGAGGHVLDHELSQTELWPARERDRRFRRFVERVDELLHDPRLAPPPVQERVPFTLGGLSEPTLRLAAERADRWCSYGGYGVDPPEAIARARVCNGLLDRFCAELGRDPRTLCRSIMLGYLYVHETPWRSEDAFRDVVERWAEAGMEEIIFVHPPGAAMPEGSVEEGLFEHLARKVMPTMA